MPNIQLWMREQMPVTNRISSVFTMSCSVSMQVYAMLIGEQSVWHYKQQLFLFSMTKQLAHNKVAPCDPPGSFIEDQPILFPYTLAASVLGLLGSFTLASVVARSIRSSAKDGGESYLH